MNRVTAIVAGIALVVGCLIGLAASSLFPTPGVPATESTSQASDISSQNDSLRAEVASLQNENAQLATMVRQAQGIDPSVFTRTPNGDYILPKDLLGALSFPAVNDDKVNNQMIEFLKMNKSEVATINAALGAAREKLKQWQQGHETVVSQTADSVTVAVTSPPDWEAAQNQFKQMVQSTLGQDRADILMRGIGGNTTYLFGGVDGKITITLNPDGTYTTKAAWQGASGPYSSSWGTSSQVPTEYGYLFQGPASAPEAAAQ